MGVLHISRRGGGGGGAGFNSGSGLVENEGMDENMEPAISLGDTIRIHLPFLTTSNRKGLGKSPKP